MPPRSPRLPGAGDVIAGKYRLERLLKQGGMGAVWIATHLGLDERVALKFMDPRRVSAPEARARFTREAKAAAQLRSSNIVQILDHGVDNEVPYIAMELLAGEDLGGRLRRTGKLSMSEAASLLDDVARALDRAHAAGIVHRDLKPENVFLAKDGEHEVPKILDFGIAMEIQPDASDDSAATQEGVLLGTPYFMSPEQVRGRANIDHRSDLWSLGVILFRAITGIRPFGRGAAADVIVQICSDPIPRASVVAPDLPEEVDRFFEKALAREAAKRFSSAKEMAAAFGEIAKLADAAERTSPGTVFTHTPRPITPSGSRRGPPPLPGSTAKGSAPPLGAGGSDGAASGGGDPTRASGVLRKGMSAPGATLGSAAARHQAPATLRGADDGMARTPAGGEVEAGRQAANAHELWTSPAGSASAEDGGEAFDILSILHPHGQPAQDIATTPPPRDVTPPPHDVAEAVTAEMSVSPREEPAARAAARAPDGAVNVDSRTPPAERASSAGETGARGRTEDEKRTSRSGEPQGATRRESSRVWIAIGGVAIAAAVVLVGFREEIFGPPAKDPGGATIVLTAGTVVLVGPDGRSPSGVATPPAEAMSATNGTAATSASASPTSVTAATSASASATSATSATASATAPASAGASGAATATTTTSATAARTTAVAGAPAATAPAADTRPKVEPKPADPKPAPTTTTSKDDRDLGY